MRRFALAAFAAVLLSGCATAAEWATWHAHPTHFASGDHLFFSVLSDEPEPMPITPEAMYEAGAWWGKPIPFTVTP